MTTTAADAVSEQATAEAAAGCTNCGSPNAAVFCAQCGEKQPAHHDVTVRHFFAEILEELFHLDSKLFYTLRTLVTRPGALTVDYFAGRKTRSITPLRLFLVLFAVQLVIYTVYKPVAAYSFQNMLEMIPKTTPAAKVFEQLAAKGGLTLAQFVERVDDKWSHNMSLFQLFNLFGTALLLKILYRRKRHLGEHLVFSAHYLSFAYLYSVVFWPVYLFTGLKMGAALAAMMVVNNLVLAAYLGLAMHRYYAQSVEKTTVKAILGYAGTIFLSFVMMYGTLIFTIIQVLRRK
jgi:hypothetical protein